MLTARENLIETMKKDGHPDRFVNNYEAIRLMMHPYALHSKFPAMGEMDVEGSWGIHWCFPEGNPGPFPIHTDDKLVVKDIETWRESVKAPSLEFSQEEWDLCKSAYDGLDHEKTIGAILIIPGVFELSHDLCSLTEALVYYMLNEQEMHDMVKYLTEFELRLAEGICEHIHPEAIFHHDDWGSEQNSFMRPSMFDDYFLDAYKEIYGYYKSHGVKYVFHHSDSYAANLVPEMIEMGIDVWQGAMESNNVKEVLDKYAGQITIMGNINNKEVDFSGWTREDAEKAAAKACEGMSPNNYIPCITQGNPGSAFDGAYRALVQEIDRVNIERFGFSQEELDSQRVELQIM